MMELLRDLWGFMRERKKFWLMPILLVLLLLGGLIVLAVIHNPEMSASMGVDVQRVYTVAFTIGLSPDVRYSVCLIASTFGSRAACAIRSAVASRIARKRLTKRRRKRAGSSRRGGPTFASSTSTSGTATSARAWN